MTSSSFNSIKLKIALSLYMIFISCRLKWAPNSWQFLELIQLGNNYGLCIFQENGGVILKRENPHKYLLYKPTVSQFLVFLASGHRELPTNGALMIYLSGDGCFSTKPQAEDSRLYLGPKSFMKQKFSILKTLGCRDTFTV